MRLDEAVDVERSFEAEPRPPRVFRLAATLAIAITWPLFILLLLRFLPEGGAVYTVDERSTAVAASTPPAIPLPAAGEGRRSGPAPFWVEPPAAKVRMKLIVPPEDKGNPLARKRKPRNR